MRGPNGSADLGGGAGPFRCPSSTSQDGFRPRAPVVRGGQKGTQATTEGADAFMCYTRRDHDLEEGARKLRAEDERRAKSEAETSGRKREKPLTEKVKQMVGAK